jgi:hypothetical protein
VLWVAGVLFITKITLLERTWSGMRMEAGSLARLALRLALLGILHTRKVNLQYLQYKWLLQKAAPVRLIN